MRRSWLAKRLDAVPVGSSIQVFLAPRWDTATGGYVRDTPFLWTKVEQNLDGSSVWRSKVGYTSFFDKDGEKRDVNVCSFAETRYHDPYRMTSDSVAHFTEGELTYRGDYVLHDVTPKPLTDKDIIRMVFLEDMGWRAEAA